ncbi:hypothetical protein [Gelidibacter japonicus]|uniref:hypothetical protein n=1 Tax=Gelidibacter japonicus TaxID=1962232 RepID=UPI003A9029BB
MTKSIGTGKSLKSAKEEYISWRKKLYDKDPEKKADEKRVNKWLIPCGTSTVDRIWYSVWQKPLRAATNNTASNKKVADLEPYMKDFWKEFDCDNHPYLMRKIGKGNGNKDYTYIGAKSQAFEQKHKIGRPKFYKIQNGARCFYKREQIDKSIFPELVIPDNELKAFIFSDKLKQTITKLSEEFGSGWGVVTILHLMTDAGTAVKPDLHLIRTLKKIGLIKIGMPERFSSLDQNVEAVRIAAALCEECYDDVTAHNLRKIDMDLLHISEFFKFDECVLSDAQIEKKRRDSIRDLQKSVLKAEKSYERAYKVFHTLLGEKSNGDGVNNDAFVKKLKRAEINLKTSDTKLKNKKEALSQINVDIRNVIE